MVRPSPPDLLLIVIETDETHRTGPRPGLLFPMFTMTTTTMHSDLLVPPIDQYDHPLGIDPIWEEKIHEKLLWRGTTTGADLTNEHHRIWSQRVRLCRRQ